MQYFRNINVILLQGLLPLSMDLSNLENPISGLMTPYGAFFHFQSWEDLPVTYFQHHCNEKTFYWRTNQYSEYFAGKMNLHLVGILGGIIWGGGTALSYIAAGKAGLQSQYALGQGAPMIAHFGVYSSGKS